MRIKAESIAFVLIASILLIVAACGAAEVASTTIPVCFIQNNGQTDDQVLYFADGAGYTLYLTANGEVISTADPETAVQIAYQDSNPMVDVGGEDQLLGKANFLIGNDESAWVTGVPLFSSVRYENLYPGINLLYHGGMNTLKSEYIVDSGADPTAIRMAYSGQNKITVDDDGNLVITTAAGSFLETAPFSYQIVNGAKVSVRCGFGIDEEGQVSFELGPYNPTIPLVIDPVYNFSTYLGGTQDDRGSGIGMDDAGNVYVVGSTQSTQFPLANSPPYQQKLNGSWDVFASKFTPDGKTLIYSTYIGGNKTDIAGGMVVYQGMVTFTGYTESNNYPLTAGFVVPKGGNSDAMITRLNTDGTNLKWSRLINGNKSDYGIGIALYQVSGQTVVVGYTNSNDFPTWPTINSLSGATDGFVAEFENDGNVKTPNGFRYLGGTNYDYANGVAVDQYPPWDIWVTGETKSLNFPTTPSSPPYPFRSSNSGGSDAFVTDLLWGDLSIRASTYLGGSGNDGGTGIAVYGNYPYVTGFTESPVSPISLFPIKPFFDAFQTTFGGGQWDAFVTKMEQNLSALNYSTYLGGRDDDKAYGIAVDSNGSAYITGWTMSTNFPTKDAIQPHKGEGFRIPDAFVTQLNQTGTGLIFSTYLGGTYYDEGDAIAITGDGKNITVTGYTESINFPVLNAYQPSLAGFPAVRFTDAFVTKIVKIPPVANFTGSPQTGCSPLVVHFIDTSANNPSSWFWDFGDGTNSTEQNPNHTFVNTNANAAMNFTVNLTACNGDGCGFIPQVNFTKVCPSPFADFIADQTTGCLNLGNNTIQFNVTTTKGGVKTGPAKVWNWSFGDGNYSLVNFTDRNVTHTYDIIGNFTVSLTYENTCCNNTTVKTGFIDIRTIPVADFNATPTSGLIPLDVHFFDNSTGRPSKWTWTFGAGEGSSHLQNPEHIYASAGAYRVKLEACNFCGCDNETKNNYIQAGIPNLSFSPMSLVVPTNDTTPIDLYLQSAENGLSGYDLKVYWTDKVHGNITGVQFPFWAMNKTHTPLPDYIVGIKAVDLSNQIHPGAVNVTLATFSLEGNISTFTSTIDFNVTVNELDDDSGNPIYTNNIPANITVVRLLPFPNKNRPPTDPFNDQIYWDVNGNGRIDFNDVTTYFQNMQWIKEDDHEYIPFFDYNGNGRIDFADLIMLFHKVPYP
jgi:PKD repeat protein